MTRRTLLALAPAALSNAQTLGRVAYRQYSQCLPDYLTSLARAARSRREAAMARLTTPESIVARQKWSRDTFWKIAGGIPERTPLNVRTVGQFEREGYRLEKLVYESRPGLVVTANLYVPSTSKPPYPGVLFQMGHSPNGKAAVPYQKCCQGLARLGYLVLAFDPIGQGERLCYPPRLSPDDQHTMAGRQMLLTGETITSAMTWDAVRSLDVLAAHPMVDPARLASTGQSGGATLTQMLMCVDDRLAAAAVSSGNTENFACAKFNPPGSTDDAEQDLIGSGLVGFDRWDMLYPQAPKPLLVTVSARDFFGTYSPNYLSDGRAEFARLASVYEKLGHRDRIDWKETPLPHALSYALRVEIYRWFERWLKGSDRPVAGEPPVHPESEETLWCGATGNTVRDFAGRTPVSFARSLPRKESLTARQLMKLEPVAEARLTVLSRVPSETVDIEAIEVATDPGVYLPGWIYRPRPAQANAPLVLMLDARGRNRGVEEGGFCSQLAGGGLVVCSADLRGNGDATPQFSRGNAAYARNHSTEEDFAWASLILGRPLLVQRVADILTILASLPGKSIVLAANGKMTVPALFAAAIDSRVSATYLSGGLDSFQKVLDADEHSHPLANFLPGLLRHADLPEIAATLAPRRIQMTGDDGWTVKAILDFARS